MGDRASPFYDDARRPFTNPANVAGCTTSSVDIAFGRSGLVRRRPAAAAWRSRYGSWGCRVGSLPA